MVASGRSLVCEFQFTCSPSKRRAEAFLICQFADRFGEGVAGMAHAIEAGRLLQGENIGKMLVQVAEGL
jgi:hypothetical protein